MKKNSLFKRVLSSILALVLIITGTISNTSIKTSARTTSLYTDATDLYDNSEDNPKTLNLDAWNAQLVGDNVGFYSDWTAKNNALNSNGSYAYRFHKGDCVTSIQSGKEHTGDLPDTYDTKEKQEKGDYIWFSTAKNDEGDIVVQYEGLWIYQLDDNNKPVKTKVDATCTVTKMVREDSGTDMDGYVGVGNDIFDVKYIHLDEVKVQYKFYKAGSNFTDDIKIKFNTTMTDLDNEQYVAFAEDKLAGTFVSENTKLRYTKKNEMDFYVAGSEDVDQTTASEARKANHALGIQLECKQFSFLFGKYGEANSSDPDISDLAYDTAIQYVGSGGYPTLDLNQRKPGGNVFWGLCIVDVDSDDRIHRWFVWDNLSERGELGL